MENKVLIIQNAQSQLEYQIQSSSLSQDEKNGMLASIKEVDAKLVVSLCDQAQPPLTKANLSYIFCFLAGIRVKLIARVFNVEPATVYTSRFRLRKHFKYAGMPPF